MRKRKALKNVISSVVLQIITIVCGFIIPKLIIQNYGSNVNGLVTSITQFLGYIALLESGFGPVVKSLLYKPIAANQKKDIENILSAAEKFFRRIACIFIVYILFLCFIYPLLVNNDFERFYTISLLIIISIGTFAEYFFGMTYRLYLQAEQHSYIISIIQICTTILNALLTIILIKLNYNIHMVKTISAIIFVMRPVLQNIYVKKKYKLNLRNAKKDYLIEKKWDGLAQHVAAVIHDKTDVAILTIFSSVAYVSVYSIYSLVVRGIKNFIISISNSMEATFGDMIAQKEYENLNKKFSIYEYLYFSLTTLLFACTAILIVPFVKVYTTGISDANYIQPVFALLLVSAELFDTLKSPYAVLTYAAGHFKETKKGAWIECVINLLLSVVFVFKFGLIGVAIGTLVAVFIRMTEFIYHSSKYILKRKKRISFSRLLINVVIYIVLILMSNHFLQIDSFSYTEWFIYAVKTFIISCLTVLPINSFIYKNDLKGLIESLKRKE